LFVLSACDFPDDHFEGLISSANIVNERERRYRILTFADDYDVGTLSEKRGREKEDGGEEYS